jgi:hypothetical protein
MTNVHKQYDLESARERLQRDVKRWNGRSIPIYDPYRPRILDHRQAEEWPYWTEALFMLFVTITAIGLIIVAALAGRG